MRKILKRTTLAICLAAAASGAYLGGIQLTGNFAEVLPGELYRSNQPSAADIADYSARYGIKTIVNLRGPDENATWYGEEIAASRKNGLTHIDFAMSATQELGADEAQHLIALLRDAPKPILIHCRSGSDRTGLASVIYLNRIAGLSEKTAEGQLSIRFGHIGIPFLSPTYAMEKSWEKLEMQARAPG